MRKINRPSEWGARTNIRKQTGASESRCTRLRGVGINQYQIKNTEQLYNNTKSKNDHTPLQTRQHKSKRATIKLKTFTERPHNITKNLKSYTGSNQSTVVCEQNPSTTTPRHQPPYQQSDGKIEVRSVLQSQVHGQATRSVHPRRCTGGRAGEQRNNTQQQYCRRRQSTTLSSTHNRQLVGAVPASTENP